MPNPDLELAGRPVCAKRNWSSIPMRRRSSCQRRPSAALPACKKCGSSWMALPSSKRFAPAAKDGTASRSSTGSTPGSVLVRNAAEGHDGPVVAVEESPGAPLQAQVSRNELR